MKKLFLIIVFVNTLLVAQKSDFKNINLSKADKIALQYKNASLQNLPVLANKLTRQFSTDIEKFRAIYFWVCNNIKSDYATTTKILNKGRKLRAKRSEFLNWNKTYKEKAFKKLFKTKATICTGYAFLLRELCSLAKIKCVIVNGFYKGADFNSKKAFPNHSWNVVLLNNKWYLCDATLASGYFDIDLNTFIFDYNDGYFLTPPSLFANNHFPENKKWTLLPSNNYNFTEFTEFPYTYSATFKHGITPVLPEKLTLKTTIHQPVLFSLNIKEDKIKDINITTYNGWKTKNNTPLKYTYNNNRMSFTHSFIKKGIYDVHIKVAKDIITTYTIEVI